MISQERLKAILKFDPDTGYFTWLIRPCHPIPKNSIAGFKNSNGYWEIGVDHNYYRAHRLAWFYITGEWPLQIDHINGIRSDNRFSNLRICDNSLNQQNIKKATRSNGSKLLGAFKNGNRWMSRILANGKRHYLGSFQTKEEAHAAYIEAKRRLHPFGEL